jgi:hypothetical protein
MKAERVSKKFNKEVKEKNSKLQWKGLQMAICSECEAYMELSLRSEVGVDDMGFPTAMCDCCEGTCEDCCVGDE